MSATVRECESGDFFIQRMEGSESFYHLFRQKAGEARVLAGGIGKDGSDGWYVEVFGGSIKESRTLGKGIQTRDDAINLLWENRFTCGAMKHLNVYGQQSASDPVMIFGTTAGLLALWQCLNIVTNSGGKTATMHVDAGGVSYPLQVTRKDVTAIQNMPEPWSENWVGIDMKVGFPLGHDDQRQRVDLSFAQGEYRYHAAVMVEHGYIGLTAVRRAITLLYPQLMPSPSQTAQMWMTGISPDIQMLYTDNHDKGVSWLEDMLVFAQITPIFSIDGDGNDQENIQGARTAPQEGSGQAVSQVAAAA